MLIGLLGKNAILIIEVANQCRKEGVSIMGAAIQGATSRLRPILMTSFAFISGLIPLAVASGAGAWGNRSIGTAAAGGMLIGTFVGIFLIPGLYVIFESLATYLKEKKQKANEVGRDRPYSLQGSAALSGWGTCRTARRRWAYL